MLQLNYTYGKGWMDQFYSFHKPYVTTEQNYTNVYSNSPSGNGSGNVRHTFAGNWVYELPFGRGKKWGGNSNRAVDALVGNWSIHGVVRLQSGRMLDFGNVRMVGFNADDLRKSFKTRKVTDPANQYRTLVYILPQDIIDNTILAYNVTATGYSGAAPTGRYFAPANSPTCIETTTGYGECGVRSLIVTGPKVFRVDMNIVKQLKVVKTVALEYQLQIFNLFNTVNFNPVNYVGATADSYQVTSAIDQSRTMQMAFRISW